MSSIAPAYDDLCAEFGFRVPRAYHRFLELAEEIAPTSPRDAFDALDVCYLENRGPDTESYTAPSEFY